MPKNKQNLGKYQKAAKAKMITLALVKSILDECKGTELKKAYVRCLECNKTIYSKHLILDPEDPKIDKEGKNLISKYCGFRGCLRCNLIRMGKTINEYKPVLEKEIQEPYFLTLTTQTVAQQHLKARIESMIKVFRHIATKFVDKKAKLFGLPWKGIRKLEVTYNQEKDKYHPHFHIILDGKESGKAVMRLWIKEWTKRGVPCLELAQKLIKADKKSYIELFKYATKFAAKDKKAKVYGLIPPKNLDIIFTALRNKRVYQPFGGLKKMPPSTEELEGLQSQSRPEGKDGDVYEWINRDWVDKSTGEVFSNHNPDKTTQKLVKGVENMGEEEMKEYIQEKRSEDSDWGSAKPWGGKKRKKG